MSDHEAVELLRECLPWIEDEAQAWDEGSGEAANLRRQATARDLADRVRAHIHG